MCFKDVFVFSERVCVCVLTGGMCSVRGSAHPMRREARGSVFCESYEHSNKDRDILFIISVAAE